MRLQWEAAQIEDGFFEAWGVFERLQQIQVLTLNLVIVANGAGLVPCINGVESRGHVFFPIKFVADYGYRLANDAKIKIEACARSTKTAKRQRV